MFCLSSCTLVQARALCVVVDPTGTPLNVRARPSGTIVGALYNGTRVVSFGEVIDEQGREWSHVATIDPGKDGWVYRRFLDCSP